MPGHAIIVGGGIGGLAAAVGLRRSGWRVTLLEQARTFHPVGAGLSLAPNAVRALDALGLGPRLRTRGVAQGAAGLRTASGRWLMRTDVAELERRFGVPAFALHRADLHTMLLDAVTGADLRTGHTVTGPITDGAVKYQEANGSGTLAADLIVAADGIRSRVRTLLFPEHPGPSYAGYVTWRGVVPAERAPRAVPQSLTETWGRGRRFGIVPLGDGQVYWYATQTLPEGEGTGESLAQVASRYQGWHAPIPHLLAATPPETLLRNPVHSLTTPLPAFVKGRVALLGDAAHAVTPDLGQGAGQALEDAVTLVAALDAESEVDAALAAYDRQRRPRTQKLVRASAEFGRLAQWGHPLAAALRDIAAAMLPAGAYLNISADTLSWRPPATGDRRGR